ncbi:MAG: stalk domain-containing protein [Clostridiales bacterium]|nr:stalk domain-containing protein [Clostridiales bacterium]
MKKVITALILLLSLSCTAFAESSDDAEPVSAPKQADLYIFGSGISMESFPIIENGTLFLPAKEFLSHLGANDFSIDEENQITVTYGEKMISMHIGNTDAAANGEAAVLPAAPFLSGETVYVPMRFAAEGLGFTVAAHDDGDILTVSVDLPVTSTAAEEYINSANLSSDTPYLVWVSKKEYVVYTFLRENGRWKEVYSCPCSIGASSTPTITGTFKYFSLEKRWSYEDFYVGPIMRFYGGYAIHSTLLKYDGSDYNATVGKKLSHGCVRVLPKDINWMVCYVPLKTTIHITEN